MYISKWNDESIYFIFIVKIGNYTLIIENLFTYINKIMNINDLKHNIIFTYYSFFQFKIIPIK